MPLLRIQDLTVDFALETGRLRAVDGVSFAIDRSETFGLVGESGSGKSVIALAIMRLLDARARVTGGQIWINAENLLAKGEAEMRRLRGRAVSMIFQEPMSSLNPGYAVGEQVAEVFRYHLGVDRQEARRRTIAMFERVKIPSARLMYEKYPYEFSGGMRQRVMIAMALACRPALLIADEPTTALDVTIQAQILDLLRELQGELQMALLFISHNLEVVANICHRVAVVYAGRLLEVAEARSLFAWPAHPYSEGLLRSIPRRGQRLTAIPGTICDPLAPPSGCRFHPRCAYSQERCGAEVPELQTLAPGDGPLAPGRGVACHFPLWKGGSA